MIEKFRARIFATSNLTVTGTAAFSGVITGTGAVTLSGGVTIAGTVSGTVTFANKVNLPYGTAAPTPNANGGVDVAHVSNVAKFVFKSGGTVYTIAMPTASNGTVTVTVA